MDSMEDRRKACAKEEESPVLVTVGEYTVQLEYSDCEETLEDRMKQYISALMRREF